MPCAVPLSLVVIARDEADRIGRCLQSVPDPCERIVVVDAATTDDTERVARERGARVVRRPWAGYVAQKNAAAQLATGPWVLSLDADEWLSTEAASEVVAVLERPGPFAGYSFPRCSEWRGQSIRHGKWYPDRKLRLFRRGLAWWKGDDPPEQLVLDGPLGALHGDILHTPYREPSEQRRTSENYATLQADRLVARGVNAWVWDPPLRAAWHWLDAVLVRAGWRDGPAGFELARLGADHTYRKWDRVRSEQRR